MSASPARASDGLARFIPIWLGQVASMTGAGMTTFALAVYVYESTRSTTSYTMMELVWFLPMIVLSPLAGTIVDRFDRRRVLMVSNAFAALPPFALALRFILSGHIGLLDVALTAACFSACAAFQFAALSALVPELVSAALLPRANGMVEMGRAFAQVVAPLAAGFIVAAGATQAVLIADTATSIVAVLTLALVPRALRRRETPVPDASEETAPSGGMKAAWTFLVADRGLFLLTLFFAFENLALGMVEICLTPLVLSFSTPAALGTILWIGGLGMVAGGILTSVWAGPKRRVLSIVLLFLFQGALLTVGSRTTNVTGMATIAFAYLFCVPILVSANQTTWLVRVPSAMHGRALGLRRVIDSSSFPLAALLSGPIVDRVLEPWLRSGGASAAAIRAMTGLASGRGIALLFTILGVAAALASIFALFSPRLLALDTPPECEGGEALAASS